MRRSRGEVPLLPEGVCQACDCRRARAPGCAGTPVYRTSASRQRAQSPPATPGASHPSRHSTVRAAHPQARATRGMSGGSMMMRRGATNGPFVAGRRSGGRPGVAASATRTNVEKLRGIHEKLVKEISQRKETQRLLLERLSRSGVQVDMSTVNRSIEEAERLSSAIRDRIRAVQPDLVAAHERLPGDGEYARDFVGDDADLFVDAARASSNGRASPSLRNGSAVAAPAADLQRVAMSAGVAIAERALALAGELEAVAEEDAALLLAEQARLAAEQDRLAEQTRRRPDEITTFQAAPPVDDEDGADVRGVGVDDAPVYLPPGLEGGIAHALGLQKVPVMTSRVLPRVVGPNLVPTIPKPPAGTSLSGVAVGPLPGDLLVPPPPPPKEETLDPLDPLNIPGWERGAQRAAREDVLNLVIVGAECAPWAKTGGLGDVMQSLPKALAARGHRVMVVLPKYGHIEGAQYSGVNGRFNAFNQIQEVGYHTLRQDGVDWVFVDHNTYHNLSKDIYSGSRQDLQFRCAILVKAALEAPWLVPLGEDKRTYGEDNLVFIANDWHAALLPFYLQAHYRDHGKFTFARSCFVVHNMAHQGRGPMADLANLEVPPHYSEVFRLYDPIGGEHMNIMKAGLTFAHQIVAVSRGYAWETQTPEGGWGLHNVMQEQNIKLNGIVNGIDLSVWSPEVDEHLKTDGYQNYSARTLATGKAACKAALQKEMGLPVEPDVPMLGFIGRLDYQKGVDLIRDNYEWLMQQNVQLIMLGSGRPELEQDLRNMERNNHDRCRGWVGFSVEVAHRITAACDILLMPSRFEPCGLNQLYAMRYGTVPVVHAVGGLRDTVECFDPFQDKGTGWTFEVADTDHLRDAMSHAISTYKHHRESFRAIQQRGMGQDLSWGYAAAQYEEALLRARNTW